MKSIGKLTKEEVDEKRKDGEIQSDKKLGNLIRACQKLIDKEYDNDYCFICIWCGKFIEHKNNIVFYDLEIYHLQCMTQVYKTEKENRDL